MQDIKLTAQEEAYFDAYLKGEAEKEQVIREDVINRPYVLDGKHLSYEDWSAAIEAKKLPETSLKEVFNAPASLFKGFVRIEEPAFDMGLLPPEQIQNEVNKGVQFYSCSSMPEQVFHERQLTPAEEMLEYQFDKRKLTVQEEKALDRQTEEQDYYERKHCLQIASTLPNKDVTELFANAEKVRQWLERSIA